MKSFAGHQYPTTAFYTPDVMCLQASFIHSLTPFVSSENFYFFYFNFAVIAHYMNPITGVLKPSRDVRRITNHVTLPIGGPGDFSERFLRCVAKVRTSVMSNFACSFYVGY